MHKERAVTFVLVGGFLGAGKTTTLVSLAKQLAAQGRRVGLITNDQAADLVDTGLARLHGVPVAEIAGGCFCCRFQDLVDRCEEILGAVDADVLLAEPVGSCADLSATVLQPLKRYYGDWFRPLPYTVLVDPARVQDTLQGPLAPSPLGYLFRKQLEEADLLVLNKLDTLAGGARDALLQTLRQAFPATPVVGFSAVTGEGLDDWWQQVQAGGTSGAHILDLDYDAYADAEAALGWLNAAVVLTAGEPFDAASLGHDLLADIRHGAARAVAEIGHVKLLLTAAEGALRCSVVRTGGAVEQTGELAAPVSQATLTFNARVELPPEELEQLFRRSLRRRCNERGITPEVTRLESLRPGRPTPTHRMTEVVE